MTAQTHRADGWPLCPICGEDELYSLADPPSIATIQGCYRCEYRPGEQSRSLARKNYHQTGLASTTTQSRTE